MDSLPESKSLKFYHLLFLLLTGCGALALLSPLPAPLHPRPVQYLPGSSFQSSITNGLTNEERQVAYTMDEGIQYLSINILMALKRPNDTGLRVMDELLLAKPERFGLLPNYVNPQFDTPLGITVSQDQATPSTQYAPIGGIACFTCHTSLISNDKGQFFLVDGAASRFQVDRFLAEMLKSMVATLINPIEFDAFYARYQTRVAANITSELTSETKELTPLVQQAFLTNNTADLEKNIPAISTLADAHPTTASLATKNGMYLYIVRRLIFFLAQTKYGNKPSGSHVSDGGPGRANPWSVAKNMISDKYLHSKSVIEGGPVSVPYNWDFDRQKMVFWSGTTNSMLERNLAQCVSLLTIFDEKTYESTCSIKKITAVSAYASKVHAPTWPEDILGAIDHDKASRGKVLYKDRCLSCHDPVASQTTTGSANYNYLDVGTDDNYVKGQMEYIDGKDIFPNMISPFINRVKEVAALHIEGMNYIDLYNLESGRFPAVWIMPVGNRIVAKPLAGVWATAPYLHNGSVPTIWDLLQPVEDRPKQFHIGGYVYDTLKLGYFGDKSLPDGFDFIIGCENCVGNSNQGHEFGIEMSDDEKWDLIEFMKSYTKETAFQ
jgi:hypothetical protein